MASLLLKNFDGTSRTFELTEDITTVGRVQEINLLVLDHPTTSSEHATITCKSGKYIIKDLESNNGTFVNGTRIIEALLKHGDIIHFAGAEAMLIDKPVVEEKAESEEKEKSDDAKDESEKETDDDAGETTSGKEVVEEKAVKAAAAGSHEPNLAHALFSKLATFGKHTAPPVEKPQAAFVHTVFFWLRDDLTPAETEKFERGLAGLQKITGVLQAHIGRPAKTDRKVIDRTYSWGLTVLFKDQAGHDAYQRDQKHIEFLNECGGFWKKILVFDFE